MEPLGSLRREASAAPGLRTVLRPTSWSYCSYTHLRLAMFGEERSFRSENPGSASLRGALSAPALRGARAPLGMSGASATAFAGRSATSCPFHRSLREPDGVTHPMVEWGTSYLSRILKTSSDPSRPSTSSMRSCDSDVMISSGVMPSSLTLTLESSTSAPVSPFDATSERAVESPPPPRSFMPCSFPVAATSMSASSSSFFMNGSGTCTEVLSDSGPFARFFEAKAAPPTPSLPVLPPIRTIMSPGLLASPRITEPFLPTPTQATSTRQFFSKVASNSMSPATVGTPTQFP